MRHSAVLSFTATNRLGALRFLRRVVERNGELCLAVPSDLSELRQTVNFAFEVSRGARHRSFHVATHGQRVPST